MRAGKLDSTIEIRRESFEDDGAGNQVPTGETVFVTLRAQVIQSSTEEFLRAYGASSESVIIFRTRWADGITLADKVTYDTTAYDLLEIKSIGRRRGLELRCRNVGG